MMGVVGRLGRVLGPEGLNAKPKGWYRNHGRNQGYQEIKAGKIEARLDKTNIIHVPVGSFLHRGAVSGRFQTLMDAILKAATHVKGAYFQERSSYIHHGPRR